MVSMFFNLIGYQLLGCVWKPRDDLLAEKMLWRFGLCLRNKWSIYWWANDGDWTRAWWIHNPLPWSTWLHPPLPPNGFKSLSTIRSFQNPYDRYQREAFSYTIYVQSIVSFHFGIRLKPRLQQSIPIAWQSFKGWAVHFIDLTSLY